MRYWILVLENAGCVYADRQMRKEYLENHELIRVATKYPNIAKDYFYNTRASDGRDYQVERFDRACTDRWPFRGDRGYRGNRIHPEGERTGSSR